MTGHKKRRLHILYILPWLAGFLLFQAAPMLYSLVCGFTDFHLFRGITETGLMNYERILTGNESLRAIWLTLKFAFLCVPLKLGAALLTAVLLSKPVRGIRTFRTLYYLPSILGSSVAAAVLWKAMFRDRGLINGILSALHLPAVSWLSEQNPALWVIILLRVWEFGAPMLLFLTALQEIPQELYDAATLDGADGLRRFFRITLPMISPVIFYNTVLAFCAALQEFSAPFVITEGGPRGGTTLISLLLYRSAFTANEMGYACALAWVLFLMSAAISTFFMLLRRRLVFFADEEGTL